MDIHKTYTHEELVKLGLNRTEVRKAQMEAIKAFELDLHLLKMKQKEINRETKRKLTNIKNRIIVECTCGKHVTHGGLSIHKKTTYHKNYNLL